MKTLIGGKTIISKSLLAEIKSFYGEKISDVESYDKDNVIVHDKDILEVAEKLKKETDLTSLNLIRKIEYVDKTDFENAYENYVAAKYEIKRNNFENITTETNLYDKLISSGIKLRKEMEKLKLFPGIKRHITEMIQEIKLSNSFNDIKQIDAKFNKLIRTSGKTEEFEKLERNLSKIIGDTYKSHLTEDLTLSPTGDFIFVSSKDEESCFLLSKENLLDAKYGVILEAENNIKIASNSKKESKLLPFSKLDKKSNYIEVYDFNPAASYAITLGEKSLSNNYREADKLSKKYHGIPLVEIDASKYLSFKDLRKMFIDFIDALLDDKNVNFSVKDDKFYHNFDIFFQEFKQLKSGDYDEGRIRNLFDHHIKLLSSSEVCDLDILLKDYKYSEIETVLKCNTFMEENIFRYKEISKPLLERFVDKFYKYRNNKTLNQIYPGFSSVLIYLKERNDDELKQLVEDINSKNCIDSWLLAQEFEPIHSQVYYAKTVEDNTFKAYLEKNKNELDEKEKLLALKEFLSQLDEDKINVVDDEKINVVDDKIVVVDEQKKRSDIIHVVDSELVKK